MSNFSYLSTRPEYSLFANSAIEAEKVFSTSPAMCAVGCRKALELAVKWVYAADKTITMPYKDNLQSLLHEPSFRFAVDRNVWSVLPSICLLYTSSGAALLQRGLRPSEAPKVPTRRWSVLLQPGQPAQVLFLTCRSLPRTFYPASCGDVYKRQIWQNVYQRTWHE